MMRRALAVAAFGAVGAWSASALAEPVRILVAVGHRFGLAAENPLKYADTDATRVRDVMVGFGHVRPENAQVLAEPSRAQLFSAIDRARGAASGHRPDEVTLVFYFSGHGDREAIHLGDERVTTAELTAKLAEVPAGLRIAVTDACRTTRDKGFVADEPFAITATSGPEASGQVWLHASGDGETAQESDDLGGAIFTHAWLNGLRGAADANGDSRVTLDESFAFAHSQTLIRSAKSSGVVQKPEAEIRLRELAPVVLTETARNVAKISLPPSRDTHFLVYAAGSKIVFSELWGAPDRRMTLALPPGRYAVQRRLGATGGAAYVTVAAGEERRLDERDFATTALDAVAQKGEADRDVVEPPPRPTASQNELAAAYALGADTRTGLTQGPLASYTYSWSRFAVQIGGGAEFSARDLTATRERLTTVFGRAGAEARLPAGAVEIHLGVGARAGYLQQTLRGANAAENGAFVIGPDATAFVRKDLGAAFFVDVGGVGRVLVVREEGKARAVPGAAAVAALGARF